MPEYRRNPDALSAEEILGDRAIFLSKRSDVSPFIAMDMFRAANEMEARAAETGLSVVHMELGQPAVPPPARVIEAAKRSLDEGRIGYTEALGIPALRERIAQHYKEYYGVELSPSRVVVTTGSSGAFLLAFLLAFDSGAAMALADPGYPAYRNILSVLGIRPVSMLASPENGFQPTPALVEAARLGEGEQGLDGLLLTSPANPTGSMIGAGDLKTLIEYCRTHGIRVISDEIYHGITFGIRAETALAYDDDAVVINSFSKYFCLTGLRVGWMVVPENFVRPAERLAQNLFISPPTMAQHAALASFDCLDELDEVVAGYARNRAMLMEGLPKAGFEDFAPANGAFYFYANVAERTNDSEAFCLKMLQETGVATTPGTDFDHARGHGYLRFSFAGSGEQMAEAIKRLKAWRP
ncbi:MAG TPA: aminotransferase class I/II-fold pyridoxal phosphate-dependent enzyme [Alphaproteobacteria bacterium]|nr:aminotransferase class I/II-fold pyridoxal phosphate-dependent enzyme [Alphaproteobacteria bacterium]